MYTISQNFPAGVARIIGLQCSNSVKMNRHMYVIIKPLQPYFNGRESKQNEHIITVLRQMLDELYAGIGYYIEIASVVCVNIAESYGRKSTYS